MTSDGENLLLRHLRKELSPEEETNFELRLFADDEFFEQMVASDIDLIDAYNQGDLSADERERFEAVMRLSPRRLARIEFSKAFQRLPERAADPSSSLIPTPEPGPPTKRSGRLEMSRGLAAAAILSATVAGTWLVVTSLQLRREQLLLRRSVQGLERQVAAGNARIEELTRDLERQRLLSSQPSAEKTLTFELTAGVLRGPSDSRELRVPETTESVFLRLTLEAADYDSYRAIIERAGTVSIWRQTGLKAVGSRPDQSVVLNVPGSLLKPGTYLVRLSGAADGAHYQPVGAYSFRITRD